MHLLPYGLSLHRSSILGDSWMGLNDHETEDELVWDGTDYPYSWSPNSLSSSGYYDFTRIRTDDSWSLRYDENNYVICQNISGDI